MNALFFDTVDVLQPRAIRGEVEWCEDYVRKILAKIPKSPFHLITELSIDNDPKSAAEHFDRFFAFESERFAIRASYAEMNGFDINPERWFCDIFAYSFEGDQVDFDWLADFRSGQYSDYTVKGLEALQQVYATKFIGNREHEDAGAMCGLLVTLKFQRFIRDSTRYLKRLNVPLYASAHDYGLVARFERG